MQVANIAISIGYLNNDLSLFLPKKKNLYWMKMEDIWSKYWLILNKCVIKLR